MSVSMRGRSRGGTSNGLGNQLRPVALQAPGFLHGTAFLLIVALLILIAMRDFRSASQMRLWFAAGALLTFAGTFALSLFGKMRNVNVASVAGSGLSLGAASLLVIQAAANAASPMPNITSALVGAAVASLAAVSLIFMLGGSFRKANATFAQALLCAGLILLVILATEISLTYCLCLALLAEALLCPLSTRAKEYEGILFAHRPIDCQAHYRQTLLKLRSPLLDIAVITFAAAAFAPQIPPGSLDSAQASCAVAASLIAASLLFVGMAAHKHFPIGPILLLRNLPVFETILLIITAFLPVGVREIALLVITIGTAIDASLLLVEICLRDAASKSVNPLIALSGLGLVVCASAALGLTFGLAHVPFAYGNNPEGVIFFYGVTISTLGGFLMILGSARKFARESLQEDFGTAFDIKRAIDQQARNLGAKYNLTEREMDVFLLLARDYEVREISDELFISPNTVRTHCKNIYRKLDINTKAEIRKMLENTRLEDTNLMHARHAG